MGLARRWWKRPLLVSSISFAGLAYLVVAVPIACFGAVGLGLLSEEWIDPCDNYEDDPGLGRYLGVWRRGCPEDEAFARFCSGLDHVVVKLAPGEERSGYGARVLFVADGVEYPCSVAFVPYPGLTSPPLPAFVFDERPSFLTEASFGDRVFFDVRYCAWGRWSDSLQIKFGAGPDGWSGTAHSYERVL
jgi:hypothetical protein